MPVIETINLTKYYGKALGIQEVNLKVEEGEIFGFIGPNGAGKSTTIRTLLNFIFPTSGEARVLGLDAVRDSKRIKELIGYLPGEVDYYDDMTVREILLYASSFYKKDCRQRMENLAGLFELDLSKRMRSLSLGNKKKVAIIQALLHSPKLLILDEPTGGLDPLMQKRFFEVLQEEHNRGTTIFFSSHILSEVEKLCHRVAIIKGGRILKLENMDELKGNAFRNVRVQFAGDVPPLDIPGIIHQEHHGSQVKLFFNGDINRLIHTLGSQPLANLLIEEPSLEEVFLHYYEKGEN